MSKPARLPTFILSIVIPFLALAPHASAGILTFELDAEFSGGTEPVGMPPWLTATFQEFGGAVQLTMTATNLIDSEFVKGWYFNLTPGLDPTQLSFQHVSTTGTVAVTSIQTALNAFKADGDGKYDILFQFQTSGGSDRFQSGEEVVYNITYAGGSLTVADFNYLSQPDGGNGPWYTAAHIQGIGTGGDESGWITVGSVGGTEDPVVPVPASLILFSVGGLALAGTRWRRRKLARGVELSCGLN